MKNLKPVSLLAGLLLALGASSASADIFSFTLDTGNPAISGYTGPYASVDVNLINSTLATVTFTSLLNNGNIFLFGGNGAVAVNVNSTSWSLSNITGLNTGTGFTPGIFSDGGAGNENGFGSFNQTINSFDGYTHSSSSISFNLIDLAGSWANALDVLALNANGAYAAAHIFVTSSPANAANGALATGFAAGSGGLPPSELPEPGALGLLGLGLASLAAIRRRRST